MKRYQLLDDNRSRPRQKTRRNRPERLTRLEMQRRAEKKAQHGERGGRQ